MPLTDLLKPEPTAPAAPLERPAGITCEKYVPGEGKRCVSYVDNGACARPDEFMCVEWMKRNAPKTDGTALSNAIGAVTPTLKEGQLLTREDVESFRKLSVEVELKSPLGTFWLVPARTGQDRMELTVEEAVTLANVVHAFGGRIASLTRDGKPLPDASPAAIAEAASLLSESEPAQADSRAEAHEARLAGTTGGPRGLPGPVVAPAEPSADDAREHLRRLRERTTAQPAPESAAPPAQTTLFDSKDGAR